MEQVTPVVKAELVEYDEKRLIKADYTPEQYNELRKLLGWNTLSNTDTRQVLVELAMKGIDPRNGGITVYKNRQGALVKIIRIEEYRRIANATGELAGNEMGEPYNNDMVDSSIKAAIKKGNLSPELAEFVKYADKHGFPYGLAIKATVKRLRRGHTVAEPSTYIAFARDFFDSSSAKWKGGDWIQMLAKDAESHALRKAFTESLGGTYSDAEHAETTAW